MIQEVPAAGNISNTTATAAGGLSTNGGETRIISPRLTGVLQPSHSSSSSTTTTTTTTRPTQENQNPLKCPRCASSNTKFCYYNNYNLTQPRHFCKTCRRYWTKGGALRNVPIGGGCRKNVNKPSVSHVIPSSLGKPYNTGKFMRQHLVSSEKMGNTSGGCDPAGMSTNSILWTTPQANHLLALLKSTQDQNPNPNLTYQILNGSGNVGAGGLCLDPLNNQIMSSFWRNKVQYEAELQQQNMNGYFMGQKTNHYADQHNQRVPGLQSTENYYLDNYGAGIFVGNVHASSSNSSDILESAPVVARAELGHCWNNASLSWPDLPTTNGAYH